MTHSFPQRKSPRLQGCNYRQNGAYFITGCTANRQYLFGKVNEDEVELNTLGCVAQTCWEQIPLHFTHVELDAFVVMPNHIHGIIVIFDDMKQSEHQYEQFSKPISGSLSTIIRSYKAAVTNQINKLMLADTMYVWQGRFHDHIIRNERSLDVLRKYMDNNPARWCVDQFYGGE